MKRIQLSNHALAQMKERLIALEIIERTLKFPAAVMYQSDHRKQAVSLMRKNGKRYCAVVVFMESEDTYRVITVFITSKIRKYLS